MLSWPAPAASATSGTSRAPSAGTPVPICHAGFVYKELAPPPPASKLKFPFPYKQFVALGACPGSQLSFHAASGMYPIAEEKSLASVALQYVASFPLSANCVPPTATL